MRFDVYSTLKYNLVSETYLLNEVEIKFHKRIVEIDQTYFKLRTTFKLVNVTSCYGSEWGIQTNKQSELNFIHFCGGTFSVTAIIIITPLVPIDPELNKAYSFLDLYFPVTACLHRRGTSYKGEVLNLLNRPISKSGAVSKRTSLICISKVILRNVTPIKLTLILNCFRWWPKK